MQAFATSEGFKGHNFSKSSTKIAEKDIIYQFEGDYNDDLPQKT